ncbi:anti-sigma factor [Extensimonas vulgaris]|uniref:Anti-sigma-K factor RskA n=1 Tax=Extensimonas vulgaris TaxID=1031594 RepID=A0A369ACK3_9BURK|nr:anti-sigma factor [Extensimonas vulgaris]RCX07092.1 anti-sigma-K factor RskA [Extensimonas vulgaris]TWI34103.1 anti-sigma-K factor RskA [Extensimonas vulgaris]TXD12584.1 anti-sigma factor [Extensimonas vulgaris]
MTDPLAPPSTTPAPDPQSAGGSPTASAPPTRRVSPWWRALSVALLLVLALGWATSASLYEQLKAQIRHLQAKIVALPQVHYVAVLVNDQQRPALLVTYDPKAAALQVQRLNAVREGPEDSMQLWALDGKNPPRSLGLVLSKYQTLQIPVQPQALQGVVELAVSVEDKGGVSDRQGPRLPYLFRGWWIQKAI